MATKEWKCYACNTIDKERKFRGKDAHRCPKCDKEEFAFPYRVFRCVGCGYEAEQGKFFASPCRGGKMEEASLDPDPREEKWKLDECPNPENQYKGEDEKCRSRRYKQVR